MKKFVTKYPVLNIFFGIVLIALSIVAFFNQTILDDGIKYIAAFLIALYTIIRFVKEVKIYKDERANVILSMELVIVLLLVIGLLFIEPMAIALTIGLVLYLQGASHLLLMQVLKKTVKMSLFIVHLILLTLGAFLIFSNLDIEETLRYIVIVALLVYGLIFFIAGINSVVKASKKKESEKPKEPVKEIPVTPEPQAKESTNKNEPTTMYTRERLMSKSVDELKQMCKARDLKGYSTLTKEKLVEKLWLYEKEEN